MRIVPVLPLLILFLSACGKEGKTPEKKDDGPQAVVEAPNGLVLRQQPDRNSRSLAVVPYGGRVRYFGVERGAPFTVDGRTGCFVWVAWQGMRGWMFDGYLKQGEVASITLFHQVGSNDTSDQRTVFHFTNNGIVYSVPLRQEIQKPAGVSVRWIVLPLPKGFSIRLLWWHADARRILLGSETSCGGMATSFLAWVDPASLAVRTMLTGIGFNMGQPVLRGAHVYYTSIGIVGKAVSASGASVWKLDNLYRSAGGASFANSFTNTAIGGGRVVFTDDTGHRLTVDDATGQNLGWR